MQIKINSYDTVETGIYNGKWQIKVGRVDDKGKFWPHFQSIKKKDGTQINVPVSLTFEHNDDIFAFLSLCAEEMGYQLIATPQPDSDVPF